MSSLMQHKYTFVNRKHVRSTPLYHGYIRAVLVEVLCNVVAAISGSHDNCLFAPDIVLRRVLVVVAVVYNTVEFLLARKRRDLGLTCMACAEGHMVGTDCTRVSIASEIDCPL